jgi:hypothetical protein
MPILSRRRVTGLATVLVGTLLVGACSSSTTAPNQKKVFPVKGQMFVGDRPAAGAIVMFFPTLEAPDSPDPRPRAIVEADGSFKLSTYAENDGAPAGDYLVTVTWPGGVLPDGREEPEDKLLGRYNDRARPAAKVAVKEGPNELAPIRLK